MTNLEAYRAHFAHCPLVAILRGVRPHEVEAIGEALCDAGFTLIEVPLNSPDALVSIARLSARLAERATVGAGTVLSAEQVAAVADAGGRLIVSPNTASDVIAKTVECGLVSLPGVFTPTEAFAAIAAGASGLKLFPAEASSPALLKAWRAVIPAEVPIIPVGGITAENMAPWLAAGASGFGFGSALYSPGLDALQVADRAARFVAALRAARAPAQGTRQA